MDDELVLEVTGLTKRFPGVVANEDVSLRVHKGEIVALLGETYSFFEPVPFDGINGVSPNTLCGTCGVGAHLVAEVLKDVCPKEIGQLHHKLHQVRQANRLE